MDPRLEEIMAGLFGGQDAGGMQGLGSVAPAADEDPRRRRAGAGSGYGGIAGGEVTLSQMLPYLRGMPQYDYSGAAGGRGGLADLLGNFGQAGPSGRHMQRQGGFEGLPPGMQGRPELPPGIAPGAVGGDIGGLNPIGGPNIAPGNINGGLALGQPGPEGPPGGMHTQAWRNVAPGYSAAAQLGYGGPGFEAALQSRAFGGPAVQQPGGTGMVAPGAAHGMEGGGGQGKAVSGAGGAQVAQQVAGSMAPVSSRAGSVRAVGAPAGGGGGGGGQVGGRPVGAGEYVGGDTHRWGGAREGGKYGSWQYNPNNPNNIIGQPLPGGSETWTNPNWNVQVNPENTVGPANPAQETALTKGGAVTQAPKAGKTKPAKQVGGRKVT